MRYAILFLAACGGGSPTPTGAVCPSPDPMTVAYSLEDTPDCVGSDDTGDCGFGKRFMDTYCTSCHSSTLTKANQRNGAPFYHDFDTLVGVMDVVDHIDEQTAFGPKADNTFMPGAGTGGKCPSVAGGPLDMDCKEPTDEERTKLGVWLACEKSRTHNF